MITYLDIFANQNGVAFPLTEAINASTSTAFDGTEYIKGFVDDLIGHNQALMREAGFVPNAVGESATASQRLEAIKKLLQKKWINAWDDGTNEVYEGTGKAYKFEIISATGRVQFFSAVSGTTGATISWIAGPYIDANGVNIPAGANSGIFGDGLDTDIRYDGHAGYGSGLKIQYFTTATRTTDTNANVSITNDATNGFKITINNAGKYHISCNVTTSGAKTHGLSLNSAQLTTTFYSITNTDKIGSGGTGLSNTSEATFTGLLSASDIVRPHTDGTVFVNSFIRIVRIS